DGAQGRIGGFEQPFFDLVVRKAAIARYFLFEADHCPIADLERRPLQRADLHGVVEDFAQQLEVVIHRDGRASGRSARLLKRLNVTRAYLCEWPGAELLAAEVGQCEVADHLETIVVVARAYELATTLRLPSCGRKLLERERGRLRR